MVLYQSFCTYSLTSKNYTEVNRDFCHIAKSLEELQAILEEAFNKIASSKSYDVTKPLDLSKLLETNEGIHRYSWHFEFEYQYIFGPSCRYMLDIMAQEVH